MKIIIESTLNQPNRVALDIHDDCTSDDVIDNFSRLMVAYGYHPESVKESILGKAEEYELEEESNKNTRSDME